MVCLFFIYKKQHLECSEQVLLAVLLVLFHLKEIFFFLTLVFLFHVSQTNLKSWVQKWERLPNRATFDLLLYFGSRAEGPGGREQRLSEQREPLRHHQGPAGTPVLPPGEQLHGDEGGRPQRAGVHRDQPAALPRGHAAPRWWWGDIMLTDRLFLITD